MICPKCGCENGNNNVYCSKCGNKLRETGGNSKSLGIAFLPLAGVLAGLLVIGGVFLLVQSHAGQETVPQETEEPGETTAAEPDKTDQNSNEAGTASDDEYIVKFNDPELRRAVCNALGIQDREITINEAKDVTKLSLSGTDDSPGQITDLTGLSSFIWLEEIDLSNNQIANISELSKLDRLKTLHLEKNRISDVSPLSSLSRLQLLDLENNNITDISSLGVLTQLTVLDIRNNNISDISVLKNLGSLKSLYMRKNKITDISAISELYAIRYLSMGENEIEDINALGNLTKLDHLIICDNKISDISVVKNFPLLKYLEIQGNPIDNYEPLSYLPENCKVTK